MEKNPKTQKVGLRLTAFWQFYLTKINFDHKDCFCCSDGTKAKIELKQWVRTNSSTKGKWGTMSRPRSDNKSKQKASKEDIAKRKETGGPLDDKHDRGGMHKDYSDPKKAKGKYQPNKVTYSRDNKKRSWWDGPGYTIREQDLSKKWETGYAWWFYVEIWKICPKEKSVFAKAHFLVGLSVRVDPKKLKKSAVKGVGVHLKVSEEPKWLK